MVLTPHPPMGPRFVGASGSCFWRPILAFVRSTGTCSRERIPASGTPVRHVEVEPEKGGGRGAWCSAAKLCKGVPI